MNYITPIVTCFAAIVYLVLFICVSNRLNKVEGKVLNADAGQDSFIDRVTSSCLRTSNLGLYKEGDEVWIDVAPRLKGGWGKYRSAETIFSITELLTKLIKDSGSELSIEPSVTGLDRVKIVPSK